MIDAHGARGELQGLSCVTGLHWPRSGRVAGRLRLTSLQNACTMTF